MGSPEIRRQEDNITKNPIVGITTSIDHGKIIRPDYEYLYLKRRYVQAIKAADGIPILLSPDIPADVVRDLCNGILIPGGEDLPSSLCTKEETHPGYLDSSERIDWERDLLDLFVEANKPVFGICYGMQLINIHFGGTLYQDIARNIPNPQDHGEVGKTTYHEVDIVEGTFLSSIFGVSAHVSSSHHQAIKEVAPGFKIAARASDGVIEAIELGTIIAVGWHPESDNTGQGLYDYFIGLVKKRK